MNKPELRVHSSDLLAVADAFDKRADKLFKENCHGIPGCGMHISQLHAERYHMLRDISASLRDAVNIIHRKTANKVDMRKSTETNHA
jgi:hypothetical protein